MGTLGSRPTRKLGLSIFQSGLLYRPDSIARRIVNMERSTEGTLESFIGAGRYDSHATALTGLVIGMGHVETFDGANQVTVIRYNTILARHQGWTRTWATLASGLTYDPNQAFPDVCLPINGLIVWSNGIDRPLVVDCRTDGRTVTPLGFDSAPAALTVLSPSQGGYDAGSSMAAGAGAGTLAPNMIGYSVPGNIGTVAQFQGEDGALLESSHNYALQWEDHLGNLSPLSALSNPATIQAQSCGYLSPASGTYVRKNKLDMLLRGFAVRGFDVGESNVKAMRLYRTTDTLHSDGALHLRARIEGRQNFAFPDGMSDGMIVAGDVPKRIIPTPIFRVACEYQGRLVVGNLRGNNAMVRWSQPGTIGTFEEDAWVVPDSGGSQITGVFAFAGAVYLFTDGSVFRLDIDAEGARLTPLSQSVGAIAPHSIQVLPDGRMAWLGRTSVFATSGTDVEDIGVDIQPTLKRINKSRAGRAVGAVDPIKGTYILAIPVATAFNETIFGYDFRAKGWHEYDLGNYYPTVFHACSGRAGHLLLGNYLFGVQFDVRVWGHPDVGAAVQGENLTTTYESVELRMDEQGLQPFRVREILIGFLETDSLSGDPSCTVRVWPTNRKTGNTPTLITESNPDGSYKEYGLELVGQDFADTWRLGNVTLNATQAYYRDPAICWRRVLVDIGTTTGFAFRLQTTLGKRMNLHAFAIIAEPEGREASRLPGPTRGS